MKWWQFRRYNETRGAIEKVIEQQQEGYLLIDGERHWLGKPLRDIFHIRNGHRYKIWVEFLD